MADLFEMIASIANIVGYMIIFAIGICAFVTFPFIVFYAATWIICWLFHLTFNILIPLCLSFLMVVMLCMTIKED